MTSALEMAARLDVPQASQRGTDVVFNWTDSSVHKFIRTRAELAEKFVGRKGTSKQGWRLVAENLGLIPTDRTVKTLQKKFLNLAAKHKSIREKIISDNRERESKGEPLLAMSSPWPYFQLMSEFFEATNGTRQSMTYVEAETAFSEGLEMSCEDIIESFSANEESKSTPPGRRQQQQQQQHTSNDGSEVDVVPEDDEDNDEDEDMVENQLLRIMETASDGIASLSRQMAQQQQPSEIHDESYFYAMSLIPRLRRLNSDRLHVARLKIEQTLCDVEKD